MITGMSQSQQAVFDSLHELDAKTLRMAHEVTPILREYGSVALWKCAEALSRITTDTVCAGSEVADVLALIDAMDCGEVLSAKDVLVTVQSACGAEQDTRGFLLSQAGNLAVYLIDSRKHYTIRAKSGLDAAGFTAAELAEYLTYLYIGFCEEGAPTTCLYSGEVVLDRCADKDEFLMHVARQNAANKETDELPQRLGAP